MVFICSCFVLLLFFNLKSVVPSITEFVFADYVPFAYQLQVGGTCIFRLDTTAVAGATILSTVISEVRN